jgi:hypothetical protein
MRSTPNTDSQFLVGFTSAILLLAATALVLQAFKWVRENHGSYLDLLTTPMFSFVDLFSWTAVMLLVIVVIISPRYIRGARS